MIIQQNLLHPARMAQPWDQPFTAAHRTGTGPSIRASTSGFVSGAVQDSAVSLKVACPL